MCWALPGAAGRLAKIEDSLHVVERELAAVQTAVDAIDDGINTFLTQLLQPDLVKFDLGPP